jgi:hypothetical protein
VRLAARLSRWVESRRRRHFPIGSSVIANEIAPNTTDELADCVSEEPFKADHGEYRNDYDEGVAPPERIVRCPQFRDQD